MRIIVNDSSALIDLRKGGILEALMELPFKLLVSDAILADELLSFSKKEIGLMRRKMTVASLEGTEIKKVAAYQKEFPALSFHDCMALVIAQREENCLLLVGDRRLRKVAESLHAVLAVVSSNSLRKLPVLWFARVPLLTCTVHSVWRTK